MPNYSLTGEILPASTISSDPLSAIDWGTRLTTTVVDVYFAPEGTYIDDYTDLGPSLGFTAPEKRQFFSALEQFEKVANLTFQETYSPTYAEFRVGTFDLPEGIISFMEPPGGAYSGFMGVDPYYLNLYDADSGNWLLSRGAYFYSILLHEFGHGLGMAHPHDEGGTSTTLEGVDDAWNSYGVGDLNQGIYTMMGFNHGWPAGPYGDQYYDGTYIYVNDFGYEAGPMALDIAVLQQKYGANLGWATGDDVYLVPASNGLGTFYECIWDAGGTDVIRFEGTADAIIDLRPATLLGEAGGGGYVSYASGIRGGYTIAAGVVIENATGGAGSDVLTGNAADNELYGSDGDDTLDGGAGADLLVGGPGSDMIYVDNAADRVGESRSWEGHDTVISSVDFRMETRHIEDLELIGSARIGAGNGLMNRITGNGGDNILDGGKNVDTLIGGLGNDTYLIRSPGDTAVEKYGEGIDTVKAYRSYALEANVEKLFMQTVYTKDGDPTIFNGVGNGIDNTIVGTPFENFLIGREGRDTLKGQAGADTFVFDRDLGADNVDRIIDFNMNEADEGDILMMKGLVFGGMAAGTLAADRFVAGTAAGDADDRFIFDQASGQLWFDADGSGAGDQVLVATFEQNALVTADDIVIF